MYTVLQTNIPVALLDCVFLRGLALHVCVCVCDCTPEILSVALKMFTGVSLACLLIWAHRGAQLIVT